MKSISKAPLRIGLAGGGTDVSPYCNMFGGEVLNAAISLYAQCTISEKFSGEIIFQHQDQGPHKFDTDQPPEIYALHAGVVKRFQKEFGAFENGLDVYTRVDVPMGSGLGTSSTLVVAILGAMLEYKKIRIPRKQIASLAYSIEREELGFIGGHQDQYAASFGGINSMKFQPNGDVIIDPVRVSEQFMEYFRKHLLLYYTSHNRNSGSIIEEQIAHVKRGDVEPLEAMHHLKIQSQMMRMAFENEDHARIAQLIDYGFAEKKKMAGSITNTRINDIYAAAKNAGALAGKISGAGGGGFMIFCTEDHSREKVREALRTFGGTEYAFHFDQNGLTTWSE